ncbi:MAG: SpoIIE family protein phosphatase [Pseudomonadota bacterium]
MNISNQPSLRSPFDQLSSCETQQELYEKIFIGLEESAPGADVSVLLHDVDSENAVVALSTSNKIDVSSVIPVGRALCTNTQIVNDASRFSASSDEQEFDVQSVYPLIHRSDRIGSIVVHNTVDAVNHAVLNVLASRAGTAIYTVQLIEAYQARHAADSAKIGMISRLRAVLNELDLETVLANTMDLGLHTIDGEVGCVVLGNAESDNFSVKTELGMSQEIVEQLQNAEGKALVLDAMAAAKPIIFRQASDLQDLAKTDILSAVTNLFLVPLNTRQSQKGCFVIANSSHTRDTDLELLYLVAEISSTAVDNALLHKHALEREALKHELSIAGQIQSNLLPSCAPSCAGIEISGLNNQCDESGGDFYDFYELENDCIAFVLGDATGHGIGAALIATTVRAYLRALFAVDSSADLDLPALLSRVNNLTCEDISDDKFMTFFIGVYNPLENTLRYSSAGHDPPLLMYHPERDLSSIKFRKGFL